VVKGGQLDVSSLYFWVLKPHLLRGERDIDKVLEAVFLGIGTIVPHINAVPHITQHHSTAVPHIILLSRVERISDRI